MEIHNFLTDLLLSVRTLFENHIFKDRNLIQSYSFGIANKSFDLARWGGKSNYDLPAAIINLNDDNYTFGERTNVISHTSCPNYNMVPVIIDVSNPMNLKSVYLQEEHITVPISITLNANSTLDVADMAFTIKRFLPLNKYIMVHKFTSFLEIEASQLGVMGIDVNSPDVKGLYTKLNQNTGRMIYCFAIEYQPLIKLESYSNTNLNDKMSKNFSLNLEITYYIQEPIWVVYQELYEVERINMAYLKIGHDPISSFSVRELKNTTPDCKKYNQVIKQVILHDANYHNARQELIDNVEYILLDLKIDKNDFILCDNFKYNIFNILGEIDYNIKNDSFDEKENKVTFRFTLVDFYKKYNPTLTTPLIFQICKEVSRKSGKIKKEE